MSNKLRAPRNRTITLTDSERQKYRSRCLKLETAATAPQLQDKIICQDLFQLLDKLPANFIDLLILDPPYNKDKQFNGRNFSQMGDQEYKKWVNSWLKPLIRTLKKTASVYICCDWQSSAAIYDVAQQQFHIQNRITWEREKGRGASRNWKNASEDIWFCTLSDTYTFNVEAVKLKRQVIAPYTDENGKAKDWQETEDGRFRLTHPSNLWTDLTIPFWSMPENTDHPTQKPEKLLAKLILASSDPGDLVFDPFLGSGTTAVVAKKLGRHFAGVEIDEEYACLTQKRLELAEQDNTIQGYNQGVFWERNTFAQQSQPKPTQLNASQKSLFALHHPEQD
jgi:site-specific DNA-methyltransferase (adenine-specific)